MEDQIIDTPLPVSFSQSEALGGMEFELKMGSCIIPKCGSYYFTPGIVGPFVKIKSSNNIFFLTANHVITQRLLYSDTVAGSKALMLVYDSAVAHKCGTVFAGEKKGSKAALVKVSDDLAPSRESLMRNIGIHFAGISPINFPTYDNRDSKNMTQVIVFGKQTRTATVKIVVDRAKERLHLYTSGNRLFRRGEAGSAVFIIDKKRILHCVGICIGGIHEDKFQFVITPIETILKQLTQEIGQTVLVASFGNIN